MEYDNNNQKYGLLLNKDALLYRKYFKEAVKLLGIYVIYRAPKKDKTYTQKAEIFSQYEDPILVGCIFEEHPTQQTLRKMQWVSELTENASLIHVPYDLPNIQ